MKNKWFAILMINVVAILMIKPSLAWEVSNPSKDQTDKINLYPLNRTMPLWETNSHSYGLGQNPNAGEIDFPLDLPVPLKIDASVQDAFDVAGRSNLVPKWEEKNIYPTFGIKYSFSRFELQDFAKSLVSLFTNVNQDSPRKTHRGNRPASFYLAFPEF